MTDILTLIQTQPITYKHFREWLFAKFNKNVESFTRFGTYPNRFKIPYIIEYLELWGVPILEALCYYNYTSSNCATNHEELCVYMISEEFKRLEQKEVINYTPF